MSRSCTLAAATALALCLAAGCGIGGYYYVAGPLNPSSVQGEELAAGQDREVTFTRGRLEVRLRPVSDDELNLQFSSVSQDEQKSTNPFTYGNTPFYDGLDHTRFTVFHLKVKNYAYPKVRIDPTRVEIVSSNGRHYGSLSLQQLDTFYRAYAVGYRGNEFDRYQARIQMLRRTLFHGDPVLAGQELEGYLVFPALHADVRAVSVVIHDAALRFDLHDEPVETVDIPYLFERQVRRQFADLPAGAM